LATFTKNTTSVQRAIEVCSTAGGCVLKLTEARTVVSAPLILKSDITFNIRPITTLASSEDDEDFPVMRSSNESGKQPVLSRWLRAKLKKVWTFYFNFL
jgi:polygalacturonase